MFSRIGRVVFAVSVLGLLVRYAYANQIAPIAGTVSLVLLGIVAATFLLLTGTSRDTWSDPSNALALLLLACALLLDGFFIAGAATFGPVRTLDVGVINGPWDRSEAYFWDGHWFATKLPMHMSEQEYRTFDSWSGNLDLVNNLDARPGRIQISLWDRQVYCVTMKNWNPPTTIGEPPHVKLRSFVELFCGMVLVLFASRIWRDGRRRGVRWRGRRTLLDDPLPHP